MGKELVIPGGWRRGYKVVAVVNSGGSKRRGRVLVSCAYLGSRVIYKPGVVTAPERGCGPLCVFGTLRDAQRFLSGFLPARMRVLRCVYKPSGREDVWSAWERTAAWELAQGTRLASQVIVGKTV